MAPKTPAKTAPSKPVSSTKPLIPAKRAAKVRPVHPFDDMFGTDTGDLITAARLRTGHRADEQVTAYYAIAPSILRAVVELWQAAPGTPAIADTTFLDIGAGKGRAMLVAAELGFKTVIGVELNPRLAAIARENQRIVATARAEDPTSSPASPVEVLQQDAAELELPDGPCVLFLFHPFEGAMMRRFLKRMEAQQVARQHPPLDILYVNAEHAKVLDENPRLERLFFGHVKMTPEDHIADMAEIAEQKMYGSTGDEECGIYRYRNTDL